MELRDFKLKEVFEKLEMDTAGFQECLRSMALLATPFCPKCNCSMTTSHMASKWRCFRRTCRDGPSGGTIPSVRIREGSFFDRTTLAEAKTFALSYFWLQDIGSVATKEYELGISHGSVVYWERFRDVCCKCFQRNCPVLGGF
ncbi:hypothetical protein Q1695_006003 [Nippostrongylus brasiliensis]|nr:hypothetical protein Q1695_006003 [Nippostrongylus brasiliensis]